MSLKSYGPHTLSWAYAGLAWPCTHACAVAGGELSVRGCFVSGCSGALWRRFWGRMCGSALHVAGALGMAAAGRWRMAVHATLIGEGEAGEEGAE